MAISRDQKQHAMYSIQCISYLNKLKYLNIYPQLQKPLLQFTQSVYYMHNHRSVWTTVTDTPFSLFKYYINCCPDKHQHLTDSSVFTFSDGLTCCVHPEAAERKPWCTLHAKMGKPEATVKERRRETDVAEETEGRSNREKHQMYKRRSENVNML